MTGKENKVTANPQEESAATLRDSVTQTLNCSLFDTRQLFKSLYSLYRVEISWPSRRADQRQIVKT